MSDLRTAAQQALEALEAYLSDELRPYEAAKTADALRAALAEPVQEPVAWIQPDHLQKARVAPFLCRVEPTQRCADFVAIYTTPPQRPPLTDEEIDKATAQERDALLDHIYEYGTAAEGCWNASGSYAAPSSAR
jgi:hypothetical protein